MFKAIAIDMLQIAAMCLIAGSGCECEGSKDRAQDPVVTELERHRSSKDAAIRERIELALSMRENNIMDSQPVLIVANAVYSAGYQKDMLYMMTYDEDRDIIGIGIREERGPADREKSIFVEEYPIFVHYPRGGPLQYRNVPIHFRHSGQRKNDQQWQDYVEGKGFDKDSITNRTRFWETLPPIYLSVPEPNNVDVFVYVYDHAGHKSDAFRLRTTDGDNGGGTRGQPRMAVP
jgi:hypothetical protein